VTKATSPSLKQDTYPTTDVSIPTDTELGTQLTSTGKLSVTGRNSPVWWRPWAGAGRRGNSGQW